MHLELIDSSDHLNLCYYFANGLSLSLYINI